MTIGTHQQSYPIWTKSSPRVLTVAKSKWKSNSCSSRRTSSGSGPVGRRRKEKREGASLSAQVSKFSWQNAKLCYVVVTEEGEDVINDDVWNLLNKSLELIAIDYDLSCNNCKFSKEKNKKIIMWVDVTDKSNLWKLDEENWANLCNALFILVF